MSAPLNNLIQIEFAGVGVMRWNVDWSWFERSGVM